MGCHCSRVESGENSDAPETGLNCSTDQRNCCQDGESTTGRHQRRPPTTAIKESAHESCQSCCYQNECQESIAEFDVLVPRLCLTIGRHERAFNALRPRGATQSTSGDSHDRPSDDDGGLRNEVDNVNKPKRTRRASVKP